MTDHTTPAGSRDDLIEQARQLIDDEVLTRTGRSVGDLASGHVARALAAAGLLADPEQDDQAAQALVDQTQMKGLSVKDGTATLELVPPHELVLAWVEAARGMLGDAPNYSETRIDFPKTEMEVKAAGEYERYVFTLQRAGKLTPHEARKQAEAERDQLKTDLAAAVEQGQGWHAQWLATRQTAHQRQARIDAAIDECNREYSLGRVPLGKVPSAGQICDRIRAALQGDAPTEPTPDLERAPDTPSRVGISPIDSDA